MSANDFVLLSQRLDAQFREAMAKVVQVINDREIVLGQLTDLERDLSTTRAHLDAAITRAEVAERATNVARDQRDEALEGLSSERLRANALERSLGDARRELDEWRNVVKASFDAINTPQEVAKAVAELVARVDKSSESFRGVLNRVMSLQEEHVKVRLILAEALSNKDDPRSLADYARLVVNTCEAARGDTADAVAIATREHEKLEPLRTRVNDLENELIYERERSRVAHERIKDLGVSLGKARDAVTWSLPDVVRLFWKAAHQDLGDTFYLEQTERRVMSEPGSLNALTADVLDWVMSLESVCPKVTSNESSPKKATS